jgi:hypothetical protein
VKPSVFPLSKRTEAISLPQPQRGKITPLLREKLTKSQMIQKIVGIAAEAYEPTSFPSGRKIARAKKTL